MNTEAQIRKNFKDHFVDVHEFELGGYRERLVWRKPNTNTGIIHYFSWGNTLVVTGNHYPAIYRWTQKISLAWVAGLDLSYFAGKCEASPTGRGFME